MTYDLLSKRDKTRMSREDLTPLAPDIAAAVVALKQGEVVAIPTETVYGLAAKISDDSAIRKIFSVKNRPFFDPLIVHVTSIEQAQTLVREWPQSAQCLAESYWPGPLTLVLPKSSCISDLITSGLDTVAIRSPRHPMARLIINALNEPVAAPSANKFGRTSPSDAAHVRDEFGDSVLVVDGGPCEVGIESTIVKLVESETTVTLTLLRSGSIVPDQLLQSLRKLNKNVEILRPGHNIEAPGQIKHHYMPSIPVLFVSREKWNGIQGSMTALNQHFHTQFQNPCLLNLNQSPEQAARELYGELRRCSQSPHDAIVFLRELYHKGDLWVAILDRLNRASSYHWIE